MTTKKKSQKDSDKKPDLSHIDPPMPEEVPLSMPNDPDESSQSSS